MGKFDDKFIPSKNQKKYLELILDIDVKRSRKQMGEIIGISEQAIWKWYKKADFVEWINSHRNRIIENALAGIYQTAGRKAKSGDYNFSRMLLEMRGDYTPRSENKNVNINKSDELDSLTDEDLINKFSGELDKFKASSKKKS